jgi:hypothetical protein
MSVDYLPQERELPAERISQMRLELESFAMSNPPRRRRGWRRRGVITGIGALVVVGGGAGTALALALLHAKPVQDHSYARCYSVAQHGAEPNGPAATFPGTTIAETAGLSGRIYTDNALSACAAVWRAGLLQPGVAGVVHQPGKPFYPVPALVGCVLPDGAAGIFPGPPDTCQRLGLPAEDPPAVEPAQPVESPG